MAENDVPIYTGDPDPNFGSDVPVAPTITKDDTETPTVEIPVNTETPTTPEPTYTAVGLDVLEDMFLAFGQGLPGLLVGEDGQTSGLTARLLPPGGVTNSVMTKLSGTDYDIGWLEPTALEGTLPEGGVEGQVLTKGSNNNYDAHWRTVVIPEVKKLTSTEVTAIASGNVADVTELDTKVLGVNGLLELLEVVRAEDDQVAASAVTADEATITKSADNILSVKAVGTDQITDASVTNVKIADNSVETAKIADANVTAAKLADDVWTQVNDIMNNGFAEVLNGSY